MSDVLACRTRRAQMSGAKDDAGGKGKGKGKGKGAMVAAGGAAGGGLQQ